MKVEKDFVEFVKLLNEQKVKSLVIRLFPHKEEKLKL